MLPSTGCAAKPRMTVSTPAEASSETPIVAEDMELQSTTPSPATKRQEQHMRRIA